MLNDVGMPLRSVENLPNYLGRSVRFLFFAFSRHQCPGQIQIMIIFYQKLAPFCICRVNFGSL